METKLKVVQTPKEWEQMECVKTTTAYGNEVMIPKGFSAE